jgi:hypothetical protein
VQQAWLSLPRFSIPRLTFDLLLLDEENRPEWRDILAIQLLYWQVPYKTIVVTRTMWPLLYVVRRSRIAAAVVKNGNIASTSKMIPSTHP